MSFFDRMLGGETQQARERREREDRSVDAHVLRQARRRADAERARAGHEQAKANHEQARARLTADLRDQTECLQFHLRRLSEVLRDREDRPVAASQLLTSTFRSRGVDEFAYALQDHLSASPYPPFVPTRTTVLGHGSDARTLTIERELPPGWVIPPEQEYRIVQSEILPVPRPAEEVRHLYLQLLARVALRTVAEAFALTPPALVDRVVLNGRVSAVDQATGRTGRPALLSVQLDRQAFDKLDLDAPPLDPELCLRRRGALISPDPYALVPLELLLSDDTERYRTIA